MKRQNKATIGINLDSFKKALKKPTALQSKKMKKVKTLSDIAKIFPYKAN